MPDSNKRLAARERGATRKNYAKATPVSVFGCAGERGNPLQRRERPLDDRVRFTRRHTKSLEQGGGGPMIEVLGAEPELTE